MKILILASLLIPISTPAFAVQHWNLSAGRATTSSLGVAITTNSEETLPGYWTNVVISAVNDWAEEADINPVMIDAGFERVRIFQDDDQMPSACIPGFACASVNRSNDIECSINIGTNANNKSAAFKYMLVLHELGHCYGLDHNDHEYVDDRDDEDVDISQAELMHASGCPGITPAHHCGITEQAKDVIDRAY